MKDGGQQKCLEKALTSSSFRGEAHIIKNISGTRHGLKSKFVSKNAMAHVMYLDTSEVCVYVPENAFW